MATGDITNLALTSQIVGGNPTLNFSVGMSPFFSNATSIQLLYWPIWSVNGQTQYGSQHWITLTRPSGNAPFTSIVPLSLHAPSGSYEIRAIRATDNTGANLNITQEQITASGFSASTILANPNSDAQPPALQSLLVGAPIFAADGIHIHFDVKAADAGSGLDPDFIIELLSPTGVSLQQWCKLDPQGIAAVEFSLNKFSASGNYKINTIRLEDLAGNNNMSQGWLQTNNIQPR